MFNLNIPISNKKVIRSDGYNSATKHVLSTSSLDNQSGAVLVEFILSFLVIIWASVGVLDIGWYARRAAITVNAVRKGARAAATLTSNISANPTAFKSTTVSCSVVTNKGSLNSQFSDPVEKGSLLETCKYLEREKLNLDNWKVKSEITNSKVKSPKINGGTEELDINSVKITLSYDNQVKGVNLTSFNLYGNLGLNSSASFPYQSAP